MNQDKSPQTKPVRVKALLKESVALPGIGPNLRYVDATIGPDRTVVVESKSGDRDGHPEFSHHIIPYESILALFVRR